MNRVTSQRRRNRRLTRWVAAGVSCLFLLAMLVTAAVARAQALPPLKIDMMNLSLRPEYDRSDALVIYDFTITNTGPQPYDGEIMFHAPAGATSEVHICEQEGGNRHARCRPYRTEEQGGESLFVWRPQQPIPAGGSYPVYIEYYYNPIQGTADKRIDFRYHPSYPVNQLSLNVAQPLRATGFSTVPAAQQSAGSPEGLTYHYWNYADVTPENPVQLTVQYTKPDNKPSVNAPAGAGSAGGSGAAQASPAVLAVGGALVLIFAVFLFLALRRPSATARPGPRPAARAPAPRAQAAAAAAAGGARAGQPAAGARAPRLRPDEQRRLARQRLLEGQISEETYRAILAELDAERG